MKDTFTYEDMRAVMRKMADDRPYPLRYYATPFEYQHALLQGWAEERDGKVMTTERHPYIVPHIQMIKVEKIPRAPKPRAPKGSETP